MINEKRKWLPTLGELIDRLSIHQLKVFIPDNRENYAKEMKDIISDINMILEKDKDKMSRFYKSNCSPISNECTHMV